MNGWIKLHRKFRKNPIYTNSKAVHVWIECLLRASHEKQSFYSKREKIDLNPGQFCMGREEFGKSIGMSGSTAWFWLQQFEVDSMVDINRTPKGSIVTIKQWDLYQSLDSKVDNKKTTDEQRMNTYKNDKNVKNNIINNMEDKSSPPLKEKKDYRKPEVEELKKLIKQEFEINLISKYNKEREYLNNTIKLLTPTDSKGNTKKDREFLQPKWQDNFKNFTKGLYTHRDKTFKNIQYIETMYSNLKFWIENKGQF